MNGNQNDYCQRSTFGTAYVKYNGGVKCPKCGFILKGQRYCPQCGLLIRYPGETDKQIRGDMRLGTAQHVANGVSNVGKGLSGFGSSMIWGCTIPLIIIILLFLFL